MTLATLPWFKGEKLGQRLFRTRALDELPRTVTHERIYILPSRRGWAFLLSLFIMLIASINYNLSLGYALCFMLTGLFCSTLLATYKNLAGLEIKQLSGAEGIAGSTLEFSITLISGGRDRFGIALGNETSVTRDDVTGTGDQTLIHRCPAIKRGHQPLGRLTVSTDYPLGLWFTWSYLHTGTKGLVYPAPELKFPPLPVTHDTQAAGSQKSPNGEFIGLREYQPEDSISTIAWKATARGLGLLVRESASEKSTPDLHLDWQHTHLLADTEARLSRLAAWVNDAHRQGCVYSLGLPSKTLPAGSGDQHRRDAMKILALNGSDDSRA